MKKSREPLEPKYKNDILRALDYHFPQKKKVILFGSRAQGTYKPGSDIDIAIDIGEPIKLHEMARTRITLENLSVPFEVDIVDMHSIPEELKKVILNEGIVWKS